MTAEGGANKNQTQASAESNTVCNVATMIRVLFQNRIPTSMKKTVVHGLAGPFWERVARPLDWASTVNR